MSKASSLTTLSLTLLILPELFTLSLSSTLSFGAVATLEFTSLEGASLQQALEVDPLYVKVKETGNKLHYSISDGLLLAQNTSSYQKLYISMGPLDEGVSLRDFIIQSVHEGLGPFLANKCYIYTACFFWQPQMQQDFVLYCRSCDKCQINNKPTTLPLCKALCLPTPDEAYQSLAIGFARPFNKSNA